MLVPHAKNISQQFAAPQMVSVFIAITITY